MADRKRHGVWWWLIPLALVGIGLLATPILVVSWFVSGSPEISKETTFYTEPLRVTLGARPTEWKLREMMAEETMTLRTAAGKTMTLYLGDSWIARASSEGNVQLQGLSDREMGELGRILGINEEGGFVVTAFRRSARTRPKADVGAGAEPRSRKCCTDPTRRPGLLNLKSAPATPNVCNEGVLTRPPQRCREPSPLVLLRSSHLSLPLP